MIVDIRNKVISRFKVIGIFNSKILKGTTNLKKRGRPKKIKIPPLYENAVLVMEDNSIIKTNSTLKKVIKDFYQ